MSYQEELGANVLIVDDDVAVRRVLSAQLRQEGIATEEASTALDALARLDAFPVDVVITDLRMPGMDGVELLRTIRTKWPEVRVILLTAHGTVPIAVEAMKAGASDFILKPFERAEVIFSVRKAMVCRPSSASPVLGTKMLFGDSAKMIELQALMVRAARATATVLVRGESGSGKEVVARAIHDGGVRKDGPFIKVHCGALPDTLLESELFGYEKGAFTGAVTKKPGRVALAEGGTLFLDEIGDITPAIQVKLLRLLQERAYEPLGSNDTIVANVRFIAATHRSLERMIEEGEFRADLFYRMNVIPIVVPSLTERPDDISLLAEHFLAVHREANGRPEMRFAAGATAELRSLPWPGNVRQLENFVERLVVLSDGSILRDVDIQREANREVPSSRGTEEPLGHDATLETQRRALERSAIVDALERANHNRTLAARLLGVSRRTLYNKLTELGIA